MKNEKTTVQDKVNQLLQNEIKKQTYTEKDMQEYAVFCVNCYLNKKPCLLPSDWYEFLKK